MLAPEREMSAHGEKTATAGCGKPLIAGGEQRGHGEPASGRVARDQDPGRADTGFEESGVGGQAVLYRGPGRGVPEQSGSPRTGRDRRPAFASSAARWVPVRADPATYPPPSKYSPVGSAAWRR
jgi:hypothetical protein